ncbi:hypothetical protein [Sporomusa acidovorans]|uniref:Uncharacterized protein n=1 Tax=Sporomusa acidovorans (strain ATCC 49682 / DSM 3132 / Mol) TaxID=1123286 RepID=A0ABZ3IX87_SPOA4|nr:hypothetical protein [Sporomusa acidovorans]OZC15822.1 periplasmic [NiFeSe] hydrogenase small subunit precursor [Sporomusa acidovorans DSM 3132]SDF30202.1 hydrogenase small subunit [Sporomusa acidovorans]
MINLLYSNTFMAAQGTDALELLFSSAKKYKGDFILVVEGAILTKDNGVYNVVARTKRRVITALEAVTTLGDMAGCL